MDRRADEVAEQMGPISLSRPPSSASTVRRSRTKHCWRVWSDLEDICLMTAFSRDGKRLRSRLRGPRVQLFNTAHYGLADLSSELSFMCSSPAHFRFFDATSAARTSPVCRSSTSVAAKTSNRTLSSRSFSRATSVGATF